MFLLNDSSMADMPMGCQHVVVELLVSPLPLPQLIYVSRSLDACWLQVCSLHSSKCPLPLKSICCQNDAVQGHRLRVITTWIGPYASNQTGLISHFMIDRTLLIAKMNENSAVMPFKQHCNLAL